MTNQNSEIYLDANATTPVMPEAAREAFEVMEASFGNPSSSHTSGLRARSLLESTRDLVRSVLGAGDGEIVFTSGATEAIESAVFSALCTLRSWDREDVPGGSSSGKRKLLYGATEHKAVPNSLEHWNEVLGTGREVIAIPVDGDGTLDLEFLRQHAADADMVCTMAVNNETGVIHDLKAVENVLRAENEKCFWVVDAVQAVGKFKLDLVETTIDYAAASGHKIYSPKGIGLLYARPGAPIRAMMAGGGQERGARGGTENLPGIAAIAKVLEVLDDSPQATFTSSATLVDYRDQLITSLREALPGIVFNTPFDHAVPTTINFSVRGFSSKELLDLFDAAGIRVSSGSACGSEAVQSYVLDAMGIEPWRSKGAIRISFAPLMEEKEISRACDRISRVGRALYNSCLIVNESRSHQDDGRGLDGLVQLKKGSMCTWLLMDSESRQCIVVDPFEELADRVESLVRCQDSRVIAVLDSHNHVDHDSCRKMLLSVLGDFALPSATTGDVLGWPEEEQGTVMLGDGTGAGYINLFNDWILARVEIPGHTVVSCAYLVGKPVHGELPPENIRFAFTGDTILMGGIGRTDFESSSVEGMYGTLQRLPKILSPETTVLCPTHDYNNEFSTTLACERNSNSFLASILDPVAPIRLEDFVAAKPGVDAGIQDETNSELVCGLIRADGSEACESSINISCEGLREFFNSHRDSLIIDVREPHEFSFAGDWSEMGLDGAPRNIPLTRLTGFLPELIQLHGQGRVVVFLCRSGRRSGHAAAVTRRMGLDNTWHIPGGIALNSVSEPGESPDPGYVI